MKKALILAIAALAFSTATMAQDSTRYKKAPLQQQPPKTGKRTDSAKWNRGNTGDTPMNGRNRNIQDSVWTRKNGKMIPDSGVIKTTPQ